MDINEKDYCKVVKDHPPQYQKPEQQGRSIKKCSILESTKEIGYRNHSVALTNVDVHKIMK